jgi:hypothetical protein
LRAANVWGQVHSSHLRCSVFPTIGFNLPGSPQRFAKVGSLRRSCWGAREQPWGE